MTTQQQPPTPDSSSAAVQPKTRYRQPRLTAEDPRKHISYERSERLSREGGCEKLADMYRRAMKRPKLDSTVLLRNELRRRREVANAA